jgi:hypothetical protein
MVCNANYCCNDATNQGCDGNRLIHHDELRRVRFDVTMDAPHYYFAEVE